MAKTINDYKKDYDTARAKGDSAGMQAANNGANAIRESTGQKKEYANQDIANVGAAAGATKPPVSSSSSNGGGGNAATTSYGNNYKPYTGGNASLDAQIKTYSDAYNAARDKGDVQGMRDANDAANQLRNQNGYAAQNANKDIEFIKGQTGYYNNLGGGYQETNQNDFLQKWQSEQDRLYEEQQRRIEEANRAAVEQAVGSLNGQKQGVNQSYSDLFKQLYIDRRMSEKNLPQQMAAMGYTGGLSESSALNIQNTYADALRKGEQERTGTMSDIDRAIADARLQGDANLANQAAQLAQNKLNSYGDLVQAQISQQNWDKQFGYQQGQDALSQENWSKSFAYQQAQDEWNKGETSYARKLELAQIMAQYGDFSGFSALDIDPSSMNASYASMMAKSGGGSGSGSGKPNLTASQALEAFNNGMDTPEVREAIKYYYGDVFGTENGVLQGNQVPKDWATVKSEEVSRKLSEMEARVPSSRVPAEALKIIQDAMSARKIGESEARRLAAQYGLEI